MKKHGNRSNKRWIIGIIGWTFVISVLLSFISASAVPNMSIFPAIILLLCFIAIGIIFDIIGLSVAVAREAPFHSMAAKRVRGAAQSLRLLRNADRVSSICNDVVGDVSGIISGSTVAVIATRIINDTSFNSLLTQMIFSAMVASLTIGGKAMCKNVSLKYHTPIVAAIGKIIFLFERVTKHRH